MSRAKTFVHIITIIWLIKSIKKTWKYSVKELCLLEELLIMIKISKYGKNILSRKPLEWLSDLGFQDTATIYC